MVLYSTYSKNRGITKLRCSDRFITSDKGEKESGQVGQLMDIERYFAAFPALERTVPSCVKKATDTYISHTATAASPTIQSAIEVSSGSLKDDQHARPFHQSRQVHASMRQNHSASSSPSRPTGAKQLKALGKSNSFNKTNIQAHKNSRNFSKFQLHRKRKPKQVKVLASKPWKHLVDVGNSLNSVSDFLQKSGKIEDSHGESEAGVPTDWIGLSTEHLEAILRADSTAESKPYSSSVLGLSHIWSGNPRVGDESSSEVAEGWATLESPNVVSFLEEQLDKDKLAQTYMSRDGSQTDLTKSWHDDYKDIEDQMSRLLFCEDLDEGPSGSRYLNTFRDNSLSYMIRKGCLHSRVEIEAVNPELKSCIHCEQSYEVVLESETSLSKPSYTSNLLNHIDSRLDFDWTKYHPPPWSNYHKDADTGVDSARRSVSCDCEYCRAKIWRKTCRWCATPL